MALPADSATAVSNHQKNGHQDQKRHMNDSRQEPITIPGKESLKYHLDQAISGPWNIYGVMHFLF